MLCGFYMTEAQQYTYVYAPEKFVKSQQSQCNKYEYDTIVIKTEWIVVSLKYSNDGMQIKEKAQFFYKYPDGKKQYINLSLYPYDAGEVQTLEYVLAIAKKKKGKDKYISARIKI